MPRTLPTILTLLLVSLSGTAHAKDLRNHLGLGFSNQLGQVTALSLRYGLPTDNAAVNIQPELMAGFSSYGASTDATYAGARLLYGVVAEDNLNLYAVAGGGALLTTAGTTIRIQPALSAEWFFFGLENLGLSAEWGVNIDLGTNAGAATTGSVAGAVHYWF